MAERQVGINEPIRSGVIYRIAIQFAPVHLLLSLPWAVSQALKDFQAEGAQIVGQQPSGVDQTSYLISFAGVGGGIPVDSFAQTLLNRIRGQMLFQLFGETKLVGVFTGAGVGVGSPALPPPAGTPPPAGVPPAGSTTPDSGGIGTLIGQNQFVVAVIAGGALAMLLGWSKRGR